MTHGYLDDPEIVQTVEPDGMTDLGPGYLDAELLPREILRSAYPAALAEFGPAALGYGADQGAGPLRKLLADRLTAADPVAYSADELLVSAGTSQMLDQLSGILGRPGDTVLVESRSYDLALRIFADHGLRVRRVAMDESGVLAPALAHACRHERAAGRNIAFAYLIPTFQNPTGRLVPDPRRQEIADAAHVAGVTVIQDDAYWELALDDAAVLPASFRARSCGDHVIRLGSFAKTLAPGIRLGWLTAPADLVRSIVERGLFVSGGSVNHLSSLAVLSVLSSGDYDGHLRTLRDGLRRRRDALTEGLTAGLRGSFQVQRPLGGFFVWVELPVAAREAAACEA